jgi:nucleotide-binding universal stress UspA family protein
MRLLVTFVSPKRSARTLQVAAEHARALGAEIIVLKVVPDAHKVGVVAELIASDRPTQKATEQVGQAARQLDMMGIAARGVVRVDEVAEGIVRAALEWHADVVYVGTFQSPETLRMQNDPIARHLIDHCQSNVILVRSGDPVEEVQPPLARAGQFIMSGRADQSDQARAVGSPYALPNQPGNFRIRQLLMTFAIIGLLIAFAFNFANTGRIIDPTSDQAVTANTNFALMDWHISGLWVINCPVAWVRVQNNNSVPIHSILFEYRTFSADGKPLDVGTYEIEGTVAPQTTKNFIELYLGLVALESERLSVRLLSVKRG